MANRVELDTTPDLTGLLAGAATAALPWRGHGGGAGHGGVPDTEVVVRDVPIDLAAVADYTEVCGFRLRDRVPLTYPHLVGFPPVVWLLTRPDFPYPLLGLVHVHNTITANDHVAIGDRVDVMARTGAVRPHPKGIQFDAQVEVSRDGSVVWTSASTYLRRGPVDAAAASTGDRPDRPDGATTVDPAALPLTARWRLAADLGRRYGAVSGDRNPIHLSALSARAFGFPRAIAHGMWTTAAAVAGLGELPAACTADVAFKRPVLLPGRVEYATARRDDGWALGVRSRDGTPHLAGAVTVD